MLAGSGLVGLRGRPAPCRDRRQAGCNPVTVGKWRHRLPADHLDELRDAPRPGAARTVGDDAVASCHDAPIPRCADAPMPRYPVLRPAVPYAHRCRPVTPKVHAPKMRCTSSRSAGSIPRGRPLCRRHQPVRPALHGIRWSSASPRRRCADVHEAPSPARRTRTTGEAFVACSRHRAAP